MLGAGTSPCQQLPLLYCLFTIYVYNWATIFGLQDHWIGFQLSIYNKFKQHTLEVPANLIWGMICRTWSVPSHIPLPPLYMRHVAPNGAQHQDGREAPLNRSWVEAPLTEKYSRYDLTDFLLWKVAQTFYTVDLAWLSGRAIDDLWIMSGTFFRVLTKHTRSQGMYQNVTS